MAGTTQAEAEAMLSAWREAELKVASGQEYEIGNRRLKRADLGAIGERIRYWEGQVQKLTNGPGVRARGLTPG